MTRPSAPLILAGLALLVAACAGDGASREDRARWEARSAAVTITRDDWGIAHVKGATDADAVFGMLYAQAEDDFHRVEMNYLNAIGRYAEATGAEDIWRDLRARLWVDEDSLRALYETAPEWLRTLMVAATDGVNYYLHTHPEVRPRVLTRFEPWMTLPFSEGSIGWDLESASLARLRAFYDSATTRTAMVDAKEAMAAREPVPTGSNGFAIAPSRSASGKALLLINPHTSHYFRGELHVTSDEGLDAYGAATWGQFFIYQGFNATAGWMHTSSDADQLDEYLEIVTPSADGFTYRYEGEERRVRQDTVTIRFRTDSGMASRTFVTYHTHHGPIVGRAGDRWIAFKVMQEHVKALTQSYTRMKAADHAAYRRTMESHTNSSNNTIFADASGNIAYFHANFVPKRDPRFDWTRPVDGSIAATEWQGVHTLDESPDLLNPPTGWIQNTNNWPWSAAGPHSLRARDYPRYFDNGAENPRGLSALAVLPRDTAFTLESLIAAAYDPMLPAFDLLLPGLFRAFDALPRSDARRERLREPVELLRAWDRRWGANSIATAVAVHYGEEVWRRASSSTGSDDVEVYRAIGRSAPAAVHLAALDSAITKLAADFGDWRTPWGEINRIQRVSPDIRQQWDDTKPSVAVPFTSARWGSLASFDARAPNGTRRRYGTYGNSFVAVVEFGERVRARAITAGGQSGDPASPHFFDQAQRYASGDLRPVYFHPDELEGHVTATYRPGERR